MLPMKLVLINQTAFKAVLKLEIRPLSDSLRFYYSIHQFLGNITDSINQSFIANAGSEQFFKALPLQPLASHDISQIESERFCLYLKGILDKNSPNDYTPKQVVFPAATIYLDYSQIFSIYNFILQFVSNYEIYKMNIQMMMMQQQTQAQTIANATQVQYQPEQTINQNIEMHISSEEPITTEPPIETLSFTPQESSCVVDELTMINDVLKLSPNNVTTYLISRYLFGDTSRTEVKLVIGTDGELKITLASLINAQLYSSARHYNSVLNVINSFNYNRDEYMSKLRLLFRQLIYIVGCNEGKPPGVPIKIIEFLIFIYSIKMGPNAFLNSVPFTTIAPIQFDNYVIGLVNSASTHFVREFITQHTLTFNKITFDHSLDVGDNGEEDVITEALTKEKYLLDVDRDSFIQLVFERMGKKDPAKPQFNLVLNNPKIISIDNFIDKEVPDSAYLCYKTIKPEQKQLDQNRILTIEYKYMLMLATTPSVTLPLIAKDLPPILARYADTILNIFKELSTIDTSTAVSTLQLLTNYIRPFMGEDATMDTELYILYKLIIPYLYDIYNVHQFVDYFH